MRTGIPCNENRLFPVGIDSQGFPCEPYRVWVYSACHCQTYQNYEQPPQTSQTSHFQSHFSVLKIGRIIPRFFSMKNIELGN